MDAIRSDIQTAQQPPPPGDRRIAELAAAQHGVVSKRQLLALGLGAGAIKSRLGSGRLALLRPGVYAFGHAKLTRKGFWLSAVLACGSDALLSHPHGAAIWEVLPAPSGRIHVTVPGSGGRAPKGIRLHRTRSLHPADRAVRDGIPVTSLARTLLDLTETEPEDRVIRAIEQAEHIGIFDLTDIQELLERSNGRRGAKRLTALIAECAATPPELRSELEHLFRALCHDHKIPPPSFNVVVEGHTVDAYWPRHNLVVELDSWEFHRNRDQFEEDRRRDAELKLAGIDMLRFTDRAMKREAGAVAAKVLRILGR